MKTITTFIKLDLSTFTSSLEAIESSQEEFQSVPAEPEVVTYFNAHGNLTRVLTIDAGDSMIIERIDVQVDC